MSNPEDHMNDPSTPTITEIENLLSKTKPRPTARLRHLVSGAPWQTQQGREISMKRLRRMEIVVTGSAILLLAVIAAVIYLQQPQNGDSLNSPPIDTSPTRPAPEASATPPITSSPTIDPADVAELAWMRSLPVEANPQRQTMTGMAYGEVDGIGRLFVANGSEGIQRFSQTGADLDPITILDPATGRPVFVRDVVWSRLLWLAPPEYGLIALTDPFESGEFLHVIDPDQGTILDSFVINNNIALPISAPTITETVPTQLTTTGGGEIYTDRIYAYPDDSAREETNALHYLLRMVIDGRILNSILVAEQPPTGELDSIISALVYQQGTENVYAAVDQGDGGTIEIYDLTGTPEKPPFPDGDPVNWQEAAALSSDAQGHIYIVVDEPGHIVEYDQEGRIVRVIGFQDNAATADLYPSVGLWLPGSIGRPLAMSVTPDGSMLFVVDQKEGQTNVTAFVLN